MSKDLRFEIPPGARLVNCRSCKAPIYFIPRPRQPEKKMPVNTDGVSHFATCPEAAEFRRKSGAPALGSGPPARRISFPVADDVHPH